jgi:Tfp pilus assembly protein PilO
VLKRIVIEKRWLMLPIAVAFVANALVYGLVVYPLHASVARGQARAREADRVLQAAEREQASAAATVTGKDRAQVAITKFYGEILPANQSAASRLMYLRLAQMARDCSLRYERRTLETDRIRESSLQTLKMTMALEGSYEDIRRFIYQIESSQPFVIVENVALGQGREPNGPLVLTLELSTFFRAARDGR